MNPDLETLLNLIKTSATLSADEKSEMASAAKTIEKALTIAEFKLDRTEKIKRTTAILLEETIEELEQKRKAVEATNRELEIESSLERVRTVAMSMSKANDMLLVCRVISVQLELLNVKEIRNVQTAIIYEDKGTYLNHEYYSKLDKTFITDVNYKLHPAQIDFVSKMLKGPEEFFNKKFTGAEVQEWYNYQKTTDQFQDPFLETASSLNYYWYSMGAVALGMSTYAPLNEEEIVLFERFRNVFEMAHRRFKDIEKAEAQAREAKIEAALEKIRGASMAMHTSEQLGEVIGKVTDQLYALGIDFETANFVTDFSDSGINLWMSVPGVQHATMIYVPYHDDILFRLIKKSLAQKTDIDTLAAGKEEKNNFFNHFYENTVAKNLPEERKKYVLDQPGIGMTAVFKKFFFLFGYKI